MRFAEFQVHYLGSSADLITVRRALEARGVVSRSRLTPGVAAVVADPTVPPDHPTLVTARKIGIDIVAPAHAMDHLLADQSQRQWPGSRPVTNTPLITIMVLVLIGVIALLGFVGALANTGSASHTTNLHNVSDLR
jgi:hypothetical protein